MAAAILDDAQAQRVEWRARLISLIDANLAAAADRETIFVSLLAGLDQAFEEGTREAAAMVREVGERSGNKTAASLAEHIERLALANRRGRAVNLATQPERLEK